MSDLVERLQSHAEGWLNVDAHEARDGPTEASLALEAAKALNAARQRMAEMDAEITRLRGLLIDAGDPAWEDARAVLVTELRKAELSALADDVASAWPADVPSWIALNLIAQAAAAPDLSHRRGG